ncbi:ABC transporter substrate-binding protein (plasmid) [Mesorhizobium sp. ORM8.1]
MISRRKLLQATGSLASLTAFGAPAFAQSKPIRIGIINGQNGFSADYGGIGSVETVKFAIEDFGKQVNGRPIELLVADHQDKADIAVGAAREWYGSGVDAIFGIANSAASLALKSVAEQFDKLIVHVGTSTGALTGASCSPNGIQWDLTTYTQSNGMLTPLVRSGRKTFFLIVADYAYGHAIEADATKVIEREKGQVLGSVRLPTDSSDYSSFIATAMASGADVVFVAMFPVVTVLKQAAEFGMNQKQTVVSPVVSIVDINALGLPAAQGLQTVQSWYWDLNDDTRAFAKRFMAVRNRAPTDFQAANYSAVTHYLKAVQKTNSTEVKTVVEAMKAMPVKDLFTDHGQINEANKMVFEPYIMQAKTLEESKGPWDFLKVVTKIPADVAFPDPKTVGCPMVKA